jgi:hypothetical protein
VARVEALKLRQRLGVEDPAARVEEAAGSSSPLACLCVSFGARGRLRRSGSGQRRRRRSGSDELGGGEVCEGGVDLAREGRRDRATSYRGEDY